MNYLLDTNVVSEMRKPHCHPAVRAWVDQAPTENLFLSALVLGEVRSGIEQISGREPGQAERLDRWLTELGAVFSDRILPVDGAIADRWGRIDAARPTPAPDALMAATAIVHSMTFVTRNIRDVADSGARLFDPWAYAP